MRPAARGTRTSGSAERTEDGREVSHGAATLTGARHALMPALARRPRDMHPAMIEAWQRALVLAPHTDDGEFGCGGTMARLVEAGCEVRYVAFSIATRSLPEGFAPDTLAREVREATAELGIPESNLTVHDFDVRTFPERRQDILELLDRALGGLGARRRLPAVASTTSTRTTRRSPPRACARSSGRRSSATRSRGTTSTSRTRRTSRSSSGTSSARSRRSRSTRRSSTAATRTPSTSGTSRRRTGST